LQGDIALVLPSFLTYTDEEPSGVEVMKIRILLLASIVALLPVLEALARPGVAP
jgi:hypothetical protein